MKQIRPSAGDDPAPLPIDLRHVARLTIELTTPFLLGSGRGDATTDHLPVLDANGFPALPGTSIAGVLRHGFANDPQRTGRADDVFGSPEGGGSRLWVTWGHIHDAVDTPVDGRSDELLRDVVLDCARALVVRDHVRIGHHGAVDGDGKFDQKVVPAGHRFTFDLVLEGSRGQRGNDESDFDWLLRYLASRRVRLGGSGRRGLGAFKVVRCLRGAFDLSDRAQAEAFCRLPVRLDEPADLEPCELSPLPDDPGWRTLTLELAAEDYWGFNGAEAWTLDGDAKAPDFNPVRERLVEWSGGRGRVTEPRLYVPGSALKGAIAHRVAFHYNRIEKRFVDPGAGEVPPDLYGEGNRAVRALFGSMHEREDDPEAGRDGARAGRVHVDDVWLGSAVAARLHRLMHTSQDRFTGGVRGGILFEERCLFEGPPVSVTVQLERFDDLDESTRAALREALRDLCEGRLALGAGTGRGHGYFRLAGGRGFDKLWQRFEQGGDR